MATNKRINGDYVITSIGATDDVIINTDRLIVNGDQDIFGTLETTGNIVSDSYSAAQFFIGDGRFLTNVNVANVAVSATSISNGTSNVSIPVANGNITFGVNLIGNVLVVTTQGATIATGTVSTSNITGALKITGGVGVAGNVYADAMYSNNAEVLTVNSVINGGTY
jgi:hypothetical protein